jgi:hypothetical protein
MGFAGTKTRPGLLLVRGWPAKNWARWPPNVDPRPNELG